MTEKSQDADAGASSPEPNELTNPARGHRLGEALIAIPIRAARGRGKPGHADRRGETLPLPVAGERRDLATSVGRLAVYAQGPAAEPADRRPLLLIHSINAAGSSYEIGPIFDRYRAKRPVYAFDLPGYGLSDREPRLYTPRIMTDAIHAVVQDIQARHGPGRIDALGLSLSAEFLARAAAERPAAFRSIALVSPTGFDSRGPRNGAPESTRGMPALYKGFTFGLWRRPFFDLLTSRISIRYFLEKTWGSKSIDEGLLEYDVLTTGQPGAEHAPYSFISGFLFSDDISRIYGSLELPVWMVHGVRGDFVDYRGKRLIEGRANWTIDVMETGALPQFERLDELESRYEHFLRHLPEDGTL